ncbi:Hypothetical protein (plasmid) [Pseudomonas putida]|nr:Hypothetical protein [Pseudomonas putida]
MFCAMDFELPKSNAKARLHARRSNREVEKTPSLNGRM